MPSVEVTITDPVGLHARPAADFVRAANTFSSAITIVCAGKTANAKSILQVISLNARQGAQVAITADGADADAALATLSALLEPRAETGVTTA